MLSKLRMIRGREVKRKLPDKGIEIYDHEAELINTAQGLFLFVRNARNFT